MIEIIQKIAVCKEKVKALEKMIPLRDHQLRIDELDHLLSKPDIWNNPQKASSLMKERQKISSLLDRYFKINEQVSFYDEYIKEYPQDIGSVIDQIAHVHADVIDFEFRQLLNNPIDDNPAILSINAGAGGLEAANWVTILLRMYMRWADSNEFKIEFLDTKPSEEHSSICTDSVSIRIDGKYAYGLLKGESGVHRLIRNSPFNAGDARHTSFAAVSVTPDIEDSIDIQINEKDIEITSQTAGGPGGQNQNRVKSAIRIKHIPTGINVIARSERDQLTNKKTAFKLLKSKLYDLEYKKREEENNKIISQLSDISFGAQIRTYTETPYSLVVDHRTNKKINNFSSVLDGNIKEFIYSYLANFAQK